MSMELFLFSAAVGAAITDYIFSTENRIRNKQERELFAKARGYCDAGDYDQALSILEQLMEEDPQNPLYCVLAIPCYGKLARIENLRRNVEKCNRLCEHTLSLVRNGAFVSQDVIDAIGAVLHSHKPLLDKMHDLAKSIGTVHGSKTKALDYAERLFVLWLANPEMLKLVQKAQTLMDAEQYAEALKCYDKLTKMDSKDGEFYFSRGLCKMKSGNLKGAKEDLDSAAASEWLSDKRRRDLKQIVATYEKAPPNPFADDPASEAYDDYISGKYDSAIRRLNRLIKLYPERGAYLMLRAHCKSGLGSPGAAIADLRELLRREPPADMRKEIEAEIARLSSH